MRRYKSQVKDVSNSRLAVVRRSMGLSLRVTAKRLGMTTIHYKDLENSFPNIRFDTAVRIADVLGVPIDELTDDPPVAESVLDRVFMLRLMKTTVSLARLADRIKNSEHASEVRRFALLLEGDVLKHCPEMTGKGRTEIPPWPPMTKPHLSDKDPGLYYGRIALNPVATQDIFLESDSFNSPLALP